MVSAVNTELRLGGYTKLYSLLILLLIDNGYSMQLSRLVMKH
jgi:hypothetical protein